MGFSRFDVADYLNTPEDVEGLGTVMRRMYRTAHTLVLSPDSFNPEHEDIVITADDDRQVTFGGRVVWFQAIEEMG